MILKCIICNKGFVTYPSRIKINKGKYCSKHCTFIALTGRTSKRKGIKLSEDQKNKMDLSGLVLGRGWNKGIKTGIHHEKQFKKGHKPWNKELIGFRKGHAATFSGKDEKNPAWKGDDVGYNGLHDWVKGKLGKPLICSNCEFRDQNSRMFHWHNISGLYLRNIEDWIRLCAKCHKRLHKGLL